MFGEPLCTVGATPVLACTHFMRSTRIYMMSKEAVRGMFQCDVCASLHARLYTRIFVCKARVKRQV